MLLQTGERQLIGFMTFGPDIDLKVVRNGVDWGGIYLPVRIIPADRAGLFRLMLTDSDCMVGLDPAGQLGVLAPGQAGDVFSLDPVMRLDDVPIALRDAAASVAALQSLARAGQWSGLQARLLLAGVTPATLRAVMASLSAIEFERVALACATDPAVARSIAGCFEAGPWAAALVGLADWNADRLTSSPARVGQDIDWLTKELCDGHPKRASQALALAARKQVLPRYRCGLVASARDEGPSLLEWIAYHRCIGIDQITIYSNVNSDGSDDLLAALNTAGVIRWIDNDTGPSVSAQMKAYGHALGIRPETLDCEWTLMLDLDEFFCFNTDHFRSLPDYLDWQSAHPVDAVLLNWLMFSSRVDPDQTGQPGAEGHVMLDRYQHRLPYVDSHVKTLLRSRMFNNAEAHVPVCDGQTAPVVRRSDASVLRHQLGGGLRAVQRSSGATT